MDTSYTIQMASKISGVGVHTIRAWEKRYKALEPHRDSAGHRVYTKSDIEKLMLLSELCLLGYTISKVAKLSIEDMKALLTDLGKKPEASTGTEFSLVKEKVQVDFNQSKTILMFALKVFKLDVIHQELGKIKAFISPKEMAMDILLPLSLEIRELASRGAITEAQEKAALHLLQFHSNHLLYKSFDFSQRQSLNVLICGIEQEGDETLSVVAGLLCQHYNFNMSYLKGNVSFEALIETLKSINPELLILNAVSPLKMAGKAAVESYLEKLIARGFGGDVLLIGKMELDRDKFPVKKFFSVQSAEVLDDWLSKKRNSPGRSVTDTF